MGLASVAAVALEKARQLGRLRAENRQLQQEFDLIHEMVGESPKLKAAQTVIARAAPTETTVLITGESGTGKELAARAIHFNSNRRDRLLVKIDCTGLTENLLASELFGHEKGAFTGAVQQKKGKLEIADGGTAFFDEIGELPLALQSQLLRVLQDREFERVGGTRPLSVDIRLVAATNRDLAEEVKKGNFREDLFYRLNVVTFTLPPLRHRQADIPVLTDKFLREFAAEHGKPVPRVTREAMARLVAHPWPGNIRELRNCLENTVIFLEGDVLDVVNLPPTLSETAERPTGSVFAPGMTLDLMEQEAIRQTLSLAGGNRTRSAEMLGISRRTLQRKIKDLGIDGG